MAKQKMVRFGVKNLKYAIKDETTGEYGAPVDLAYAEAIALQDTYTETPIYGDGEIIMVLGTDKGETGTLTVTNIEKDYEIACGRQMELDNGLADVQQRCSVRHAIYYETEAIKDGQTITIKNWLLNCYTGKASESYAQTKDSPTINTYEYPITILGEIIKNNAGTDNYTDANGNTVKCTKLTCYPDDTGYSTFASAVPVPKAKAASGSGSGSEGGQG